MLIAVRERHGERVKKQRDLKLGEAFHSCKWIPAFAGMAIRERYLPILKHAWKVGIRI